MFAEFFSGVMRAPYRFLIAAAVLAALLCLFPARVEEEPALADDAAVRQQGNAEKPAAADLSERTSGGCMLHRTLYYAPCGHSVQRREPLPAQLIGLSRQALEQEIPKVIPDAAVTGFSGAEVDVAQRVNIPCPLHWVLTGGEDGMLAVMQNRSGDALEIVRETDVPISHLSGEELELIRAGRIFDDVQALEGYLESLSS